MSNVFSKVAGVEKISMIDMRGYVSCVLFSPLCAWHCPYCHNKSLKYNKLPLLDPQEIKDYLLSRKNLIDYVVFSGGECTIHRDYLISSARWCKEQGFKVKIDTNGDAFFNKSLPVLTVPADAADGVDAKLKGITDIPMGSVSFVRERVALDGRECVRFSAEVHRGTVITVR